MRQAYMNERPYPSMNRKRGLGEGNTALTGDRALAVFLLACTSSSIFDTLEHAFADTIASAFPLLFDSLALFFVRSLDDRQSVSLLELD